MNQGQPSSFFNDPTEDHPGPLPSSSFFNDPTEDHPGPLPPSPPDSSPQLHPPSSPLHALHTDSGRVLAAVILVCCVSIGLFFHVSPLVGGMLFLMVLLTTLAIEWRSFTTLYGRINWPSIFSRKRFWLIGVSVFVFVVTLMIYLVRAVRGCYQFTQRQLPEHLRRCRQWGRAAARKVALIIGSGRGHVVRVYRSCRAKTRMLNYLMSQGVLPRLFAALQACAFLLRSSARALVTATIAICKATASQQQALPIKQSPAISTPVSLTPPISIPIPAQGQSPKGQSPRLPENHPYARHLDSIQAAFVAGGAKGDSTLATSKEERQAVHDFVNAEDWDATRQVVEAQQRLLFRAEVEALFEWNIAQAKEEQWKVDILEQHLALLRDCQKIGIAEAFEKLAAARQGTSDRLASADEHVP